MQLTHQKTSNVLVIGVEMAYLDAKEASRFKERLLQLIEQEQANQLVFDLDKLQFIDSSGLGAMLSILRYVNQRGGDLKLARMQKPIRAIFEMVRMHKLFEIYPNIDDATRSFS